jgi:hypothetical protein
MLPRLSRDPFFGAMAAVTIGLRLCIKVSLRSSCDPLAVCLSLCRAHRSCRTKERLHSGKSQWYICLGLSIYSALACFQDD